MGSLVGIVSPDVGMANGEIGARPDLRQATTTVAQVCQPTPPPVQSIRTGTQRGFLLSGDILTAVVELGRLRAPIVSRAVRQAKL
jgi:hypothetical protein